MPSLSPLTSLAKTDVKANVTLRVKGLYNGIIQNKLELVYSTALHQALPGKILINKVVRTLSEAKGSIE